MFMCTLGCLKLTDGGMQLRNTAGVVATLVHPRHGKVSAWCHASSPPLTPPLPPIQRRLTTHTTTCTTPAPRRHTPSHRSAQCHRTPPYHSPSTPSGVFLLTSTLRSPLPSLGAMRTAGCMAVARRCGLTSSAMTPQSFTSPLQHIRRRVLHTTSASPFSSSTPRWTLLVTAAVLGSVTASAFLLSPPAHAKAQPSSSAHPRMRNESEEGDDGESLQDKNKAGLTLTLHSHLPSSPPHLPMRAHSPPHSPPAAAFNALQSLLGDRCSIDLDDRTTHGKDAYSVRSSFHQLHRCVVQQLMGSPSDPPRCPLTAAVLVPQRQASLGHRVPFLHRGGEPDRQDLLAVPRADDPVRQRHVAGGAHHVAWWRGGHRRQPHEHRQGGARGGHGRRRGARHHLERPQRPAQAVPPLLPSGVSCAATFPPQLRTLLDRSSPLFLLCCVSTVLNSPPASTSQQRPPLSATAAWLILTPLSSWCRVAARSWSRC